jgi:hypothetical protein
MGCRICRGFRQDSVGDFSHAWGMSSSSYPVLSVWQTDLYIIGYVASWLVDVRRGPS